MLWWPVTSSLVLIFGSSDYTKKEYLICPQLQVSMFLPGLEHTSPSQTHQIACWCCVRKNKFGRTLALVWMVKRKLEVHHFYAPSPIYLPFRGLSSSRAWKGLFEQIWWPEFYYWNSWLLRWHPSEFLSFLHCNTRWGKVKSSENSKASKAEVNWTAETTRGNPTHLWKART